MLLMVIPHLWFVPVVSITLALSNVIFTPLQAVNSRVAPADRVGEAMAAVGVCKEISSVLGNILVAYVIPAMRRLGVSSPLRWLYPFAATLGLSAYFFARRIDIDDVTRVRTRSS